MSITKAIIYLSLLLLPYWASSQVTTTPYGCVDSTRMDPYYQGCDHSAFSFMPVCACGKTYFSSCVAEHQYGVYSTIWRDGVCDNFAYFFYPNPLFNNGAVFKLFIKFKQIENNAAYFYVMDIFGRIRYKFYIQTPAQQDVFDLPDLSYLPSGMYITIVNRNNEEKFQKLVIGSSQ